MIKNSKPSSLKTVSVPEKVTYVGVFLSFRCTFVCPYCLNRINGLKKRSGELTGEEWIRGLNRLGVSRGRMVPITLQGGEPSQHRNFIEIIQGLRSEFYLDVLTNLDFDIEHFMQAVPPERFQRDVAYPTIRVSYHPGFSPLDLLIEKIERLQDQGYSIGLFAVEHPENNIQEVREKAHAAGIDFRTKEFLGWYGDELHGRYMHPEAVGNEAIKTVQCRTTELLIAPDGNIHKCHSDLYEGVDPVGNLLDPDLAVAFPFRECARYGRCNPCDIKLKTNRFQEFGYCAVEIR